MARRCCCGPGCVPTVLLPATSDWTTGVGGTVTSDGSGGLDIDGPVDPSSFVSSEAYEIEFSLSSGSVTFTFGTDTIEIDVATKTLTGNLDSVQYGRVGTHSSTDNDSDVYIRVTPSHIFAYVTNAWDDIGSTPAKAHGAIVVTRDGSDPPTSFDAEWTSANISGFVIRDSKVAFSAGGAQTADCGTPPAIVCPYYAIKQLTANHKYDGVTGYTRDVFMPDVTITGYIHPPSTVSPISTAFGTKVSGIYPMADAPFGPGTVDSTTADYDWARGHKYASASCLIDDRLWAWFLDDSLGFDFYYKATLHSLDGTIANAFQANVVLRLGTATSGTPYPIPYYDAILNANYRTEISCTDSSSVEHTYIVRSEIDETLVVDVNDLDAGFTISATAVNEVEGFAPPLLIDGSFSIDPVCDPYTPCCDNPETNTATPLLTLSDALQAPDPLSVSWTL